MYNERRMKMKCNNCGKEIVDESKFCQYCGEKCSFNNSDFEENREKLENANGKEENTMLIGLCIFLIPIIIIAIWQYKSNQEFSIKSAKIDMLSALQKYSTTLLTVDDYDIEKIEIENTYEIYKVKVNKTDYLKNGYFYVALVKPTGSWTDTVLVNDTLYGLKEFMNK